jgi:hypothetical protein
MLVAFHVTRRVVRPWLEKNQRPAIAAVPERRVALPLHWEA